MDGRLEAGIDVMYANKDGQPIEYTEGDIELESSCNVIFSKASPIKSIISFSASSELLKNSLLEDGIIFLKLISLYGTCSCFKILSNLLR